MNKPFHQFFFFLAGSFVCLYLAFSSAVNIPYASHDSIRYFHKFYNRESDAQTLPMEGFLFSEGRPLTAVLEQQVYKNVNHLSDVSRLRLITIVVFALNATLLAMIAVSASLEALPAFCLSTAIFTLPGVQQFIFVPYLPHTLAIALSLLNYFILRTIAIPASPSVIPAKGRIDRHSQLLAGIQIVIAFLLLEVSFFIYPPSTFFFLVPAALMLVFHQDWRAARKMWARDVLIWISVALINYLILKHFFYAQIKSSHHEISFTWAQILKNIALFVPHAMPQTFNLWNVYYSKTLGFLVMFMVALFLAAHFLVTRKIGWGRLLTLTSLFSIFNLVWFLFGGYMPQEFIASQAWTLALVYWCGDWFGNFCKTKGDLFIRIWPVIFMCFGLIIANQMMLSNVLNNYSELMFFRSRLAQLVDSSTKEIHIITLKDTAKGYNGLPMVYDDINSSTAYYEIPDLVRVALRDVGEPFDLHCIVTYSNYGQPFNLLPGAVVIDMNDLVNISSTGKK